MRKRFDEQLGELNINLIEMGSLCEEAIAVAVKELFDDDDKLRVKVKHLERRIDEKERDIEQLCMKLLMQQQPVAKDLRNISSALKMISDMERIGDQALDISEITKYIVRNSMRSKIHIQDMAKATVAMVTKSIDSFVKKDLNIAREVMKDDDIVDDYFDVIKGEVVENIVNSAFDSEYYIDLIMIAKYLERIGDHAVNIAEWVEYSITGEHVSGGNEEL